MTKDPGTRLAQYLRPEERLLWSGRPDPAVRFSSADAYLIPFSIMWAGFAVFWEASVLVIGAPLLFDLWGLPFVALGLYMLFGRFVVKRRQKLQTAYGVTTGRAIVAIGTRTFNDYPLGQAPSSIRRSRDGSHVSVTFGTPGVRSGFYANSGMEFLWRGVTPTAFYDAADAQALLAALDQARG